jgi:hypothetical protein
MYTPLKNFSPKIQLTYSGYYNWSMRLGTKRSIKHFLTILLAVNVGLLAAPTTSQSAETAQSDFVEWTNGFNWLDFELNGSHTDIQRYFPWYKYDFDNSAYISIKAPVSIRIPSAIKLDFSQKDCINLPIKIRREVSHEVVADISNPLNIEFYQFPKTKGFPSNQLLTVGPSNWVAGADTLEIQLPVCKIEITDPRSSSLSTYLNLSFSIKYSRDLASLRGETSKCKEIISDKCVISERASAGISIVTSAKQNLELISLYETSIKNLQDLIDSNPCYPGGVGDQLLSPVYCVNALRNIQILRNELLPLKTPLVKVPLSKSSAKKSLPITCAKGKTIKKFSGANSKCPKGYVKK